MDLNQNAKRFTGKEYVTLYHEFRPDPPKEIIHQSLNYVNLENVDIIADLGCGTGISTRIWSDYAKQVIGIEPSKEMIAVAEEKTEQPNVIYKNSFADDTKLRGESIDIITCSQSFHWMEPKSTLKEVYRILKPGGVLVIYDVIWPPSVNYLYESAYRTLFQRVDDLTEKLNETIAYRWNRKEHLTNIQESGYFRFCKKSYYHKSEPLRKNKFIGIALSQGGLEALLKRRYTEQEIGLEKFKEKIHAIKDIPFSDMTYHYHVLYAIK